jgi:anti-sigma factor RsiW
MTENLHNRAQTLFSQSLVEGLSAADQSWLEQHLHACAECARETAATCEILQALRNVPVALPHDLAARTQLRVRLRAQEAMPASNTGMLLWVITGMSWLLGILSAPLVWRGFSWVGSEFGLPKLALEFGFVLWWTIPALIAVGVVLHQRAISNGIGGRRFNSDKKAPH